MLNDISIQKIAAYMNYSVDWLCHLYRRATGNSIGEAITRQKMNSAVIEIQNRKYSILEISIKYGYETQEGFSRAFKKYFGETPSKYKVTFLEETEREKVGIMYDRIILEEIKCCTVDEKLKLLDSIDMILDYSRKVCCFGILSLEKELMGIENVFLKRALQMMINGKENEQIKQILWNYIWCSRQKSVEIVERIIFLEGILAIQEGIQEDIIRDNLTSYLGEEFIKIVEDHYGLSNELLEKKRNDYLLKMNGHRGDEIGFEKMINKMNERSLQRLLREIDVRTMTEVICGLNSKTVERLLKNVSVRTASNVIDEIEKGRGVSQSVIEGARDYVIKMMHRLVENKDIMI